AVTSTCVSRADSRIEKRPRPAHENQRPEAEDGRSLRARPRKTRRTKFASSQEFRGAFLPLRLRRFAGLLIVGRSLRPVKRGRPSRERIERSSKIGAAGNPVLGSLDHSSSAERRIRRDNLLEELLSMP